MNKAQQKKVRVAVGVVQDNHGRILIAKRAKEQHQGGLWEFPGGKVEPREAVLDALIREFKEEVDLTIQEAEPLIVINHDYGDKCVLLDVWLCSNRETTHFLGEAKGNENQEILWVPVDHLERYQFPEANQDIITAIKKYLLK